MNANVDRRSLRAATGGIFVLLFSVLVGTIAPQRGSTPGAPLPPVKTEQMDRWMKDLSNWGRWGKDDQRGTLNLITPTKRLQAQSLAKRGVVISLGRQPLLRPKAEAPSTGAFLELNFWNLSRDFVMERQEISLHGTTYTHLDALCHAYYDGKFYNGFTMQEVVSEKGCAKDGIDTIREAIVTRGVLIDIPRLKGVRYLEAGTAVQAADIEAWERQAGVKVSSGDVILLRTGRWTGGQGGAGYDVSVAAWFKARDVAIVGSDWPQEVSGQRDMIHKLALVGLGTNLLDNADLEQLAETSAQLKQWEFLLIVAPIPMPGGSGSLVNPQALF
jgi:kynurenine formamidase